MRLVSYPNPSVREARKPLHASRWSSRVCCGRLFRLAFVIVPPGARRSANSGAPSMAGGSV